MSLFRNFNREKPKLFAVYDHTNPSDVVNRAVKEFSKHENLSSTAPYQREKICREFLLQRLQNIAKLPGMEEFEAIDKPRLPKMYHDFQSFVNQCASLELTRADEVLVNWNAPIKFKLVLLPDSLT